MDRYRYPVLIALFGVAFAGIPGCDRDGQPADAVVDPDATFAELQERGEQAMGVDQYTSTHLFDALVDGGRIELQRDVDDPDGVAQIRRHLQEIAGAFRQGEFTTPAFVHMQDVPGTSVMAAKRDVITYVYRELPRGGELRIVTKDRDAVQAIHEFMAFQRSDHRAGGTGQPDHGDMDHGAHEQGGTGHDMDHETHEQTGAGHDDMDHETHEGGADHDTPKR